MSSERSLRPGTRISMALRRKNRSSRKCAGEDFGAEVAIRGGDQADIDFSYFGRADALNFAVLNDAQQLGLHLR